MSAFDALAVPVRRRILELLADGEQSVGTLVTALTAERPITQPAVSQHLRTLRDARLVRVRADGTLRLYALDPAGVDEAAAWLQHLRDRQAPFEQPLDALATEVVRGRRASSAPHSDYQPGSAAG